MGDVALRIIDYKTGTLPTRKSVADGSSPQLLVEAVIAHNQGFGTVFPTDGDFQLEYWRLTGGEIYIYLIRRFLQRYLFYFFG